MSELLYGLLKGFPRCPSKLLLSQYIAGIVDLSGFLLPIENFPISISSLGDNVVVQGVPGKRFVCVGLLLVVSDAVSVTFKSGATAFSGAMPLAVNCGFTFPFIFRCNFGESFVINLSAAKAVGGIS